MSEETKIPECDTLIVVDDEGKLFLPVATEDEKIVLSECTLLVSKDEFEEAEIETIDDLNLFIDDLAKDLDADLDDEGEDLEGQEEVNEQDDEDDFEDELLDEE